MDNTKEAISMENKMMHEWYYKFRRAMINKQNYVKRWRMYKDAYNGDFFKNIATPDYRSDVVVNYVFSILETIRPILVDNDPKFQALPRQPEGMNYSDDLQEALMYEWDREKVNTKLYSELINYLTIGNMVGYVPFDQKGKQIKYQFINPMKIFPDEYATSVDDAEFIIYATYVSASNLKKMFPKKSHLFIGSNVNYSELFENEIGTYDRSNQILTLEVWCRDYDYIDIEEEGIKKRVQKYPNGRVITFCPEINVLLSDKANPYSDGRFPFIIIKNYDIPGKFWGEGDIQQLLSPQKAMNDLNNAIIDNAKSTANMPWIIDKNSGIPKNGITARPGLIIRKNPGSEVKRDQPPSMPPYVSNTVELLKNDMEFISGVHNTLRGENSSGVYTAQGIISLQEAGMVRIRLKVKGLEEGLSLMAQLGVSRMKQFWNEDKFIRITKFDGSYDLKLFKSSALENEYDIKVTAGSTMPVNRGAMLDMMVRLAQTPMPDGQTLVDREAVAFYLPQEVKSAMLRRMGNKQMIVEQQIQQMTQAIQQVGEQLQQVATDSAKNDEEIFNMIEGITASIEKLNEKTLQLNEKHDTIVKEKKELERIDKIKSDAYNSGYFDAEKLLTANTDEDTEEFALEGEGNILEDNTTLPDDLLQGIEELSDDQLKVLLERNPKLVDLIK